MISLDEKKVLPDLSVLVRAEKLQLLYRQSFPAVFISAFNALLLLVILWTVQEHKLLLGWFVILLMTALARLYVFVRYRKAAPQGDALLAWEKPYFITLTLSSLVWGIGCVIIMPLDSPLHQAVIYYCLIGMSGGAISVYSAHRVISLVTIAVLLLPVTAWFLFQRDMVFIAMAIGAVIFFFSAIRATNVLSLAFHQNFQMTHELRKSKDYAEKLARIDELTGIYNRRAFYEYGKIFANQNQRNKQDLAVILMDIDNFKQINDSFGHAAGDAALQQIGKFMLQRLRKSDVFARIGGEEFGILLPATTSKKAAQLAEELRHVIAHTPVIFDNQSFTITASFGVTTGQLDIDSLVRQADIAMYQSKEAGRNTVVTSTGNIKGEDDAVDSRQ